MHVLRIMRGWQPILLSGETDGCWGEWDGAMVLLVAWDETCQERWNRLGEEDRTVEYWL